MKNANTSTVSPAGLEFRREIWKKRWENIASYRQKSEEEFDATNQKLSKDKNLIHHSQMVLNDELAANKKILQATKPEDPNYVNLLEQRKDLFEKLEQSFHKGSPLRDQALTVMNDLYAEIHAYMTYRSHLA